MKYKKLLLLSTTLLLSACSNNSDNPFDVLGGGGEGTNVEENENIKIPDDPAYENYVSKTPDYTIDLSNVTDCDNYKLKDSVLTISKSGTYELTGNLTGAVEIKKEIDGDVEVILNNANISPTTTQDNPGIVFKKLSEGKSFKRVLTIKDGTTNTVKNEAGDVSEQAAIISKSDLIIDGKGKLNVITNGAESNGIQAKQNLYLQGVDIDVSATKNGIKGNVQVFMNDSNIVVNAGNDGIKTDIEASSQTEADSLTKDYNQGLLSLQNSSLNITAGDDGLMANSYMHIKNSTSNNITIKTNGGAPSSVTEQSSDAANGKAIKVAGISIVDENENETKVKSQTDYNYLLNIEGGTFNLDSNSDAISSEGINLISGGTFNIASGDDGIHGEYLDIIKGGTINITKCYEGIEAAQVEIYDGDIDIVSSDDGINAANGGLNQNYSFNLYIGGGDVYVNAQGDGVDSNGSIEFKGGSVIIDGPTQNDNGALDSDKGIMVNGGNLIAIGSSGMVETPSSNSSQCSIVYNLDKSQSAGTNVTLLDSSNNELLSMNSKKTFQSVVISSNGLKKGDKVTLKVGSNTQSITISDTLTKLGNSMQGQTGPGGGQGGGQGGGNNPGGNPGGR